jgi:hypothetical protein
MSQQITPNHTTPQQEPALQEQIAHLQQFVTHLQAQLQNQLQTNTQSRKGLKVAVPDVFDGTLSRSGTFLSQLSLYFQARRFDFQDDQDKITFALSYMRGGTAGPWADQVIRQQDSSNVAQVFPDWNGFKEEFEKAFGDPNPAGTARYKMDQLKQGSHTADEYVASFRELVPKTGYNDEAHVEIFQRGLNPILVDRIYALPEMPQSLKGWMEWATKLDRQWRQREANKRSTVTQQISKAPRLISPTPSAPTAKKEPEGASMEIDAGRQRKTIVCFKCRKPGHIARNCQSTVDVRTMDYESIKAIMKEELQKEGF